MKKWKESGESNEALAQMGRSGGWVGKVEGQSEELEQRYMYRHTDCIRGIHYMDCQRVRGVD